MLGKWGGSTHWLIEVDWRTRGRRYDSIKLVHMQLVGYNAVALNMTYLQVVTMASSLSSFLHVKVLHRRAYSIIAESVAQSGKKVQREPESSQFRY